jgi:hypothetical protein
MSRAEPSGISLPEVEAAIVKGMIVGSDRQHDIAAWFEVNSGRIADISTGRRFAKVSTEAADKSPPPDPHLAGRDAHAALIALEAAAETIRAALSLIRERVKTAETAAEGDIA